MNDQFGQFKYDKKIICQINQEIMKTSDNNHNSWKALQLAHTYLLVLNNQGGLNKRGQWKFSKMKCMGWETFLPIMIQIA